MKKHIALILALVTVLCLCAACGKDASDVTVPGKDTAKSDPGMDAVSTAVKDAADSDIMTDIPESYMTSMMKLPADSYSECCARISSVGININEYGVFKTDDPEAMKELLQAYLEYREEIWMDEYLPEEYPKLENAEIWVAGDYVMYAILDSETMDAAEIAFKGCFEG